VIILAMLIATYAVYGAGRQVLVDAREGVRTTRERAVRRVGEIRKDRKASRVKRAAATGAVGIGLGTGVVWRGARHTRRTITTGVKWGAGEGRERHRERVELGEVQARIGELGDRETDAGITEETPEYTALHEEYYALRDQHRADRAGRAGRPVPEKVAARIDRRRAQTEATARGDDPDRPGVAARPEPPTHRCDGTCTSSNLDSDEAEARGLCRDCGGQGELVWNFGTEHGHIPCRACNPDGPRWKRPRVPGQSSGEDAASPNTAQPYPLDGLGGPSGQAVAQDSDLDDPNITHTCRDCGGDGINQHYPNAYAPDHPDNTNGGTTTMSTPVSTVSGAGLQSTRNAWTVFGQVAGEQVASSADAQGHVVALTESVTTTLDDARMAAAAAGEVVASLADSGAGDNQAVADAEVQQAAALAQVTKAEEALAAVEQVGVAISALSDGAEAGQAHCASSLAGLNDRWAPKEAFVGG